MADPIVYVDRSEIREGKLDEVKLAMKRLADFVDAHEPQLVSYAFYVDRDERLMTVVAVHRDTASMELHMDVAGEEFRRFAELIDLVSIDVYGEPSAKALDQLHQKARMLGRGTVTVHTHTAGFSRRR